MEQHTVAGIDHTPQETGKKGSFGSVLAILLIVSLLVVGAFYVWGQRIAEKQSSLAVPVTEQ